MLIVFNIKANQMLQIKPCDVVATISELCGTHLFAELTKLKTNTTKHIATHAGMPDGGATITFYKKTCFRHIATTEPCAVILSQMCTSPKTNSLNTRRKCTLHKHAKLKVIIVN